MRTTIGVEISGKADSSLRRAHCMVHGAFSGIACPVCFPASVVNVPMARELYNELGVDWSEPLQIRVDEHGELVFRKAS